MANTVSITQNIGGTPTVYYLSGSKDVPYMGTGTPWDTFATTPIRIAMNDVTGPLWTPQAPQAQLITSGGPPFTNGSSLVSRSYSNRTETIPIQINAAAGAGAATAYNNAVDVLQRLRLALTSGGIGSMPFINVTPNSATTTASFEIVHGSIQETADFINRESGRGELRAVMTLVLRPFGGTIGGGETVITAGTVVANIGTGSPTNVIDYSLGSGDLVYEGSPLNIRVTPTTASQDIETLYLATVAGSGSGRGYTALTYTTAVATTFSAPINISSVNFSNALNRAALKGRVLWRITASGTGSQFQVVLRGQGSGAIIWRSALVVPGVSGLSGPTIMDFGEIPLDVYRNIPALQTSALFLDLYYAGNSLTSASFETLAYYDFAKITNVSALTSATFSAQLSTFNDTVGVPALPVRPNAATVTSGNVLVDLATIRGTAPRYFRGQSLYIAWLRSSGSYSASDRATINVKHAPLYHTLRGTT